MSFLPSFSVSVAQVIVWTRGRLVQPNGNQEDLEAVFVNELAPLGSSGPDAVSFYHSRAFSQELVSARPKVLLTSSAFLEELSTLPLWNQTWVVLCPDPYWAMAILSEKFAAVQSSVAHLGEKSQTLIHETALIHPSVELGSEVSVGAYCVIEAGVKIGAKSVLYPHCTIGPKVKIGSRSVLFSNVTLYEWTQIGSNVRIHAGSVIGADGFGYAPEREGQRLIRHQKIFHLGRVVIEDEVEIGANTCIDRGTFGDTRVGLGAKIDNLVQMGHNATVDQGAVICGGVCLAGNAHVGKFAYVGGVTGISNHVRIGDGAMIGACSLISKDVPPLTKALGNPQRSYQEHFRAHAWLNRQFQKRGESHGK